MTVPFERGQHHVRCCTEVACAPHSISWFLGSAPPHAVHLQTGAVPCSDHRAHWIPLAAHDSGDSCAAPVGSNMSQSSLMPTPHHALC